MGTDDQVLNKAVISVGLRPGPLPCNRAEGLEQEGSYRMRKFVRNTSYSV